MRIGQTAGFENPGCQNYRRSLRRNTQKVAPHIFYKHCDGKLSLWWALYLHVEILSYWIDCFFRSIAGMLFGLSSATITRSHGCNDFTSRKKKTVTGIHCARRFFLETHPTRQNDINAMGVIMWRVWKMLCSQAWGYRHKWHLLHWRWV